MSATEHDYANRDRIKAALKVWVLTVSGAASLVLGVFALNRPS